MKHFLGEEWSLYPAGGATGEAYIAQQGDQKIFIKRNSSPFLAVLSAEGIVPKLLWTRRLENGDVITAQQWVNCQELKAPEMCHYQVPRLLAKIHRSDELLTMFMRLGNSPLTPQDLFEMMKDRVYYLEIKDPHVVEALEWLDTYCDDMEEPNHVVCHADVNHNNWIASENELYLVDWDGAIVADPALDLAPLLYLYVPKSFWSDWLREYDLVLTGKLKSRLQWYMVVQCVENVLWYWQRQEFHEITKWTDLIGEILQETRYDSY